MTRVLYIAPEYPSVGESAAQVRANALLPCLRAMTDLRVLAFPPDGHAIPSVGQVGVNSVERGAASPIELALATFSRYPRAFMRYRTRDSIAEMRRILTEFQPDVVHFDTIGTLALLETVLAAPRRPKIVAHTHDAVSQLYRRLSRRGSPVSRALSWIEWRKYLAYENVNLRSVDAIIVDSVEDANYLSRSTAGVHVATIPIGVDLSIYSPTGPYAPVVTPALVFSGSMASAQSVDAAMFLVNHIMPMVWGRHSDCHLYLVGNRPGPRVRDLVSERVHVTGFVEDLPAYLRSAAAYVCPLRMGSGMRTRVVEALACGAPVIASPMALRGLVEAPEAGALPWIVAQTSEEFTTGIDAILNGLHPEIAERASAYASQKYSWNATARSILRCYRDIGVP